MPVSFSCGRKTSCPPLRSAAASSSFQSRSAAEKSGAAKYSLMVQVSPHPAGREASSRVDKRRRRRCAASHPGSQDIDLASGGEGVEAVLDQPADAQQASERPPCPDHAEVDVGAVAADDVSKVLFMSKGHVARSYRASPRLASD